MKYDVKKIITELQKLQKKNPDTVFINDAELLLLAASTIKVNCIHSHIKRLNKYFSDKPYYDDCKSIDAASKILMVERATIYKWIKDGIVDIEQIEYAFSGNRKYISLRQLLKTFETLNERRLPISD